MLTVLVPAFNAERTLARALDSVAAQSVAPGEVIVVDDGSADGTAALAQQHAVGARVLRHGANRGSSAALTTALSAARHDLVAFLDADDEWLPAKLEAQLGALAAMPGAAIIATGFAQVTPGGAVRWTYGEEPAAREGADFWKALLEHSMIAKPTVLTRRSLIERAGGLDPSLAVAEDQDLWIRLALLGPVRYLPQPLVRVHEQAGSLSRRQRAPDLTHVLPLIERYLERLDDRLTAAEVRHIRRRRYAAAAANLIDQGYWREGWGALRVARTNGEPLAPHLRHGLSKLPGVRALLRAAGR